MVTAQVKSKLFHHQSLSSAFLQMLISKAEALVWTRMSLPWCHQHAAERRCSTWLQHWMQVFKITTSAMQSQKNSAESQVWNGSLIPSTVICPLQLENLMLSLVLIYGQALMSRSVYRTVPFTGNSSKSYVPMLSNLKKWVLHTSMQKIPPGAQRIPPQ